MTFAITAFLLLGAIELIHYLDRKALHQKVEWERERSDQKVKHLTDQIILLKVTPHAAAAVAAAPEEPEAFISPLDDEKLAEFELERIDAA